MEAEIPQLRTKVLHEEQVVNSNIAELQEQWDNEKPYSGE